MVANVIWKPAWRRPFKKSRQNDINNASHTRSQDWFSCPRTNSYRQFLSTQRRSFWFHTRQKSSRSFERFSRKKLPRYVNHWIFTPVISTTDNQTCITEAPNNQLSINFCVRILSFHNYIHPLAFTSLLQFLCILERSDHDISLIFYAACTEQK
jgi:hypothetical protein